MLTQGALYSQGCDVCCFVSDKEAEHFKYLLKDAGNRVVQTKQIIGVSNGIDFDYFNPDLKYLNPYPADKNILVFTGAMDYWANIDAVDWFAKTIFKELYQYDNNYQFYIVGSSPSAEVQALEKLPGITVSERAEDIRPYIKYATIAIAPLRIARGAIERYPK